MTSSRPSSKSVVFEVGPNYIDFKTLGEGAYGIVWYVCSVSIFLDLAQLSMFAPVKESLLKNQLRLNIRLSVNGLTERLKFYSVLNMKMYV